MYDGVTHTVIASLTLVGGFVLLVIAQVTGNPLQPGTLTLVTMLMSAVTGWYFGTRSTLSGAQAVTEAVRTAPTPTAPEPASETPAPTP